MLADQPHFGPRQLVLMCLLVSLFAALLPGCRKAVPTPEPVTIRFSYIAERVGDDPYYGTMAAAFREGHPSVTVELVPMSWEQVGKLREGDPNAVKADVYVLQDLTLYAMQNRGELLKLDSWIAQDEDFDLSDFYPGPVALCTHEGDTWGIPFGVDFSVMYYNKDLFDKYDVPYPQSGWTWDDFLQAADAIRDVEAKIYGYAIWNKYNDVVCFIHQHGGRVLDEDLGRVTFDDPQTIEALQWLAALIHEHDVAPTPDRAILAFGGRYLHVSLGITQGQVGMWIDNYSNRGGRYWQYWAVPWPMTWGVVSLPRDVRAATDGGTYNYAISARTEHPDASWSWVRFLGEQMPYSDLPARRSLVESDAYEELVGEEAAAAGRAALEGLVVYFSPQGVELWERLEPFWRGVDAIIKGEMTAEEAMEWAQDESQR